MSHYGTWCTTVYFEWLPLTYVICQWEIDIQIWNSVLKHFAHHALRNNFFTTVFTLKMDTQHVKYWYYCCTWHALALDGLGDDGQWLVAGLTQHLTQLLHTVAVHNDRLPAGTTQEITLQMQSYRHSCNESWASWINISLGIWAIRAGFIQELQARCKPDLTPAQTSDGFKHTLGPER